MPAGQRRRLLEAAAHRGFAGAGGALAAMLALCVPGAGTTAVLLAMPLALDMTPGALAFRNEPGVIGGVIRGLIAALSSGNLARHAISAEGPVTRVLPAPPRILVPLAAMICCPVPKSSG